MNHRLTSVRPVRHTRPVEAQIGPFGHNGRPQDLGTPETGISPREAPMCGSDATRTGRPSKHEQRRRTARFLELAARGVPYDQAAAQSGVKAERALRIVSDPGFQQTLSALGTAA